MKNKMKKETSANISGRLNPYNAVMLQYSVILGMIF